MSAFESLQSEKKKKNRGSRAESPLPSSQVKDTVAASDVLASVQPEPAKISSTKTTTTISNGAGSKKENKSNRKKQQQQQQQQHGDQETEGRHPQGPAEGAYLTHVPPPPASPSPPDPSVLHEFTKPDFPKSSLSDEIAAPFPEQPHSGDSDQAPFDVFDNIAGLNEHERDVADRTTSWTKSIPYGKPPPSVPPVPPPEPSQQLEGISLGESPGCIAAVKAFENEKAMHTTSRTPSYPVPDRRRGSERVALPSPSPGTNTGTSIPRSHSSSFGNPYANYPGVGLHRHMLSDPSSLPLSSPLPDRGKRISLGSYQPLPPHAPSAHYYSPPPDTAWGPSAAQTQQPPPDGPYTFCAFDTLPTTHRTSRYFGRILLLGRDRALEVLSLDHRHGRHNKPRTLARLEGLDGRVLDAKIVPWTKRADPFRASRPHVVVIVHGQVPTTDSEGFSHDGGDDMSGVSGRFSERERLYVQTSVQVFSLRTRELVATLFASKPKPCLESLPGHPLNVPGPIGGLKLHVSACYVLVSSSVSGEVYIYTAGRTISSAEPRAKGAYQCIGKTWASIRTREPENKRYSVSSSSTMADFDDFSDPEKQQLMDFPLLSVSGRYLAVVSPSLSTKVSIQGAVPPELLSRRSYGVNAHTPPARPSTTCLVDEGQGDSFLNKFARGLTQEFVRGARWIGDQGLQTWNNYWNKDGNANANERAQGFLRKSYPYDPNPSHFPGYLPPTHAHDMTGPEEPDVVSIFDLRNLQDGLDAKSPAAPPSPVAVFQPRDGCSFLSLAPSSLLLLTANKKGDAMYVWDLMQARRCRAKAYMVDDGVPSPLVRQVARYQRMTTSSVVDVVWTAPDCSHVAVVTRKGTVHVHDIPRLAFQWPPPRRFVPVKGASRDAVAQGTDGTQETSEGSSSFAAALNYIGTRTQPIFTTAAKLRKPSVGNLTCHNALEVSAAAGLRGKKVVSAGLSRSVDAATGTVSTIRHSRDNKLHLATFASDPLPGRITWLKTGAGHILGVIDGNAFRAYAIRRSTVPVPKGKGKAVKARTVIGAKLVDVRLPSPIQPSTQPEPMPLVTPLRRYTGFWNMPSSSSSSSGHHLRGRGRGRNQFHSQPLSQAELNSNLPYQPFHTDRRVTYRVYPSSYKPEALEAPEEPWAFGGQVPGIKLNIRSSTADEDGEDYLVTEVENLVRPGGGAGRQQQVVITTTRKKKKRGARRGGKDGEEGGEGEGEDGFFEDDCEVLDFADDRV